MVVPSPWVFVALLFADILPIGHRNNEATEGTPTAAGPMAACSDDDGRERRQANEKAVTERRPHGNAGKPREPARRPLINSSFINGACLAKVGNACIKRAHPAFARDHHPVIPRPSHVFDPPSSLSPRAAQHSKQRFWVDTNFRHHFRAIVPFSPSTIPFLGAGFVLLVVALALLGATAQSGIRFFVQGKWSKEEPDDGITSAE